MNSLKNNYTMPMHICKEKNAYIAELTDNSNRNIKLFAIEGKKSGRIEELELRSSEDFSHMSKMCRKIIYAPNGVNNKFKTVFSDVLSYIQDTDSKRIEDIDLIGEVINNGDFAVAVEIDGLLGEKEAVIKRDREKLKLEISVKYNNMSLLNCIENASKDKKERFYDKLAISETVNAIVAFMNFFIFENLEETRFYEDVAFEVAEEILGEKIERRDKFEN